MNFDWLDSVGFFTIDLGLDRVYELLKRLGNPERNLKFLHVAGSNGKGSVCTFLETGLRGCGYSTGFYSSPHLVSPAERYRLNGKIVDNASLEVAADKVRAVVETMRSEGKGPTYFEITTVIAIVLFAQKQVDFAIWETGLGGRLDATNVVIPELSVITGISLEHTDYLGSTLAAIAKEKAGIIKNGVPVVCGPLKPEALAVIRETAAALNAPLIEVMPYDADFHIFRQPDGSPRQELTLEGERVRLPLPGVYQRNNAKVAAAALAVLARKYGFELPVALHALEQAEWPARMQFIPSRNLLIDGAHNPEGAEALSLSLRELSPNGKFHFIAGCFADKNAEEVLRFLAPLALDFQFINFDGSGRAVCPPEQLSGLLAKYAPDCPSECRSLESAIADLPRPGLTVLTGSLHMCGEALALLQQDRQT